MPAKTRLTSQLLDKFIEILAENGGIVCDAADALNVSRTGLYAKREDDENFKTRWLDAVDRGVDLIEDEARRRALVGTDHPVIHQGTITDSYKEKSDFCLGLILRGYRSQFRQRTEISGPGGEPIQTNVTIYLPENGRDDADQKMGVTRDVKPSKAKNRRKTPKPDSRPGSTKT